MRNTLTLARREISSYLVSPIAYVVTALFLALTGSFFAIAVFEVGQPASMRMMFEFIGLVLIFILPILTMKSLAEEFRSGTIETLMTTAVSDVEVVLGKFIGCMVVFVAMLVPTVACAVVLSIFGNLDWGPVVSGYVGLVLLGGMYVAVGILTSSMTRNQVVAAVIGVVVLLALGWIGPMAAGTVTGTLRDVIRQATVAGHVVDFRQGVIDAVHVVYFVVLAGLALFVTVKVLESRRWR